MLVEPQLSLWETPTVEDPDYLARQLITYIGNKRTLVPTILGAVGMVKMALERDRLRILDVFSGSGVVTRALKAHATEIVANDLEPYAEVISRCFLTNRSGAPIEEVRSVAEEMNRCVDSCAMERGFIEELYAPRDERKITASDRLFYTRSNARRLDNYRRMISLQPQELQPLLLGPLLSEASIHANTAGVFKGFYKDRETGIGKFGGSGSDALDRILGPISIAPPVLSRFDCDYEVHCADANALAGKVGAFDLAYIDPPYNQHPYGSNYFMLNLLTGYERPDEVSRVSGIPVDWQRSDYNVRARAFARLQDLIRGLQAKFVLLSYNNEGFVSPLDMRQFLSSVGDVHEVECKYNTFRGSRNLRDRSIHVTEHLFLIRKT